MSFWEKFKEFDEMMSKPALAIRIEKTIDIPVQPEQDVELIEENNRLRALLEEKKVNAIETEAKLLE